MDSSIVTNEHDNLCNGRKFIPVDVFYGSTPSQGINRLKYGQTSKHTLFQGSGGFDSLQQSATAGCSLCRLFEDAAAFDNRLEPTHYLRVTEADDPVRFSLLRAWLVDCRNPHSVGCREASCAHSKLPKRLLWVANLNKIQLCFTSELQVHQDVGYATSSHCWGSLSPLQTSQDNEQAHLSGFSETLLSSTFADAARTTRKLDLRYLWTMGTMNSRPSTRSCLGPARTSPLNSRGPLYEKVHTIYGSAEWLYDRRIRARHGSKGKVGCIFRFQFVTKSISV
ncbi:hypothetical protein BD289DRAFT_442968 [Coniella lustricola]|uniref:Heterokaryon incompatibility domain-containing protein n=1 Tax=Coniella lustricola TaxID=2025994 RepID=A0A2T2ZXL3_9PEZI|nr:hypothetical protein BD289DRAFT_442968 [Coniella lustricola]